MATPIRQDQKAAVVDHKMQPPDLLARSPADLPIRGFDVRGRPAEAQQGHPLVIELGHVAETASAQPGVVEVVVLLEQFIEAGAFAFFDLPHAHPAQPGLFGACRGSVQVTGARKEKAQQVRVIFEPPTFPTPALWRSRRRGGEDEERQQAGRVGWLS